MTDYISREAALNACCENCLAANDCRPGERCADYMRLKELPAADVRPVKWIPVTERLPDFEGCLLCMRKAFVGDNLRYQDILYYEEGTFYMEFEDTPIPTECITHWMPLPQPPKEET